MPLRIVAKHPQRQARRGQFRTTKKHVPNVAKSAQHPHSKLKTQKELKKITDSSSYKKADYKKKTEMLGGKVLNYAKGGSAKKPRPHGPHMWVRGDKRKKYAEGGSVGAAVRGKGCEIK